MLTKKLISCVKRSFWCCMMCLTSFHPSWGHQHYVLQPWPEDGSFGVSLCLVMVWKHQMQSKTQGSKSQALMNMNMHDYHDWLTGYESAKPANGLRIIVLGLIETAKIQIRIPVSFRSQVGVPTSNHRRPHVGQRKVMLDVPVTAYNMACMTLFHG